MKRLKADRTFSSGIAIGTAFVVMSRGPSIPKLNTEDSEKEISRLKAAINEAKSELIQLSSKNDIFAAHLELVQDEALFSDVCEVIKNNHENAEWALEEVINRYSEIFAGLEDEYMRARGADIQDVGKRLQNALLGVNDNPFAGMCEKAIVVARDLTPSDTANMDMNLVKGFITEEGGVTSHVSIIARTAGLPALVGVKDILGVVSDGDEIIMDAKEGVIFISPDPETLSHYRDLQRNYAAEEAKLKELSAMPSVSSDGRKAVFLANVGGLKDISAALSYHAEGVGLFRTEFLYMGGNRLPTEDEQFEVYRQAAGLLGERPLIIRTLDIGGDKELPYFDIGKESNPFLGYRAIRICLNRPDIFKAQLRALLRAGTYGDIRIMYPMIISTEELDAANNLLQECKNELEEEDVEYKKNISVGMMIETPASVLLADRFAKKVGFFSIGTNDLTQYTLAVDRGNKRISGMYDPFHPAVLAAIERVIRSGHAEGIPVGMCGEFAGDKRAFKLLIGMGLDEFSVSARAIPELKAILRSTDAADAETLAARVLACETKAEVMTVINT